MRDHSVISQVGFVMLTFVKLFGGIGLMRNQLWRIWSYLKGKFLSGIRKCIATSSRGRVDLLVN